MAFACRAYLLNSNINEDCILVDQFITFPYSSSTTSDDVTIEKVKQPISVAKSVTLTSNKSDDLPIATKRHVIPPHISSLQFQIKQLLLNHIVKVGYSIHNILDQQILQISSSNPDQWVSISSSTELNFTILEPQKKPQEISVENSIGGVDDTLNSLREIIKLPFLYSDILEHLNIEPPKGLTFVDQSLTKKVFY